MKWSLSEFLNLIELRSQSWCFVDMAQSGGFTVLHNEAILFYGVLAGKVTLSGVSGGAIEVFPGDCLLVLSGEAHALRGRGEAPAGILDFLNDGEYVDAPPTFSLGKGRVAARLLCGRLKVRWPGGQQPKPLPPLLSLRSTESFVDLVSLANSANGPGASSMLTQLATLIFVQTFREHPQGQAIFQQFDVYDPILRAREFIEKHPFQGWTVSILAGKVGMGRSNFASRFVAETGKTPMEAVTEERMKLAADYLENTRLKLSEVSDRVGYRSEAAFHRRFRGFFGMTPGQWRRQRQRGQRGTHPRGTV